MADQNLKCKFCLYRYKMQNNIACYYIGFMRHRRPCPADHCTVFEPYDDKKRRELETENDKRTNWNKTLSKRDFEI